MAGNTNPARSTYSPDLYDEYYNTPPDPPALVAPKPQRLMPEMSDHISENLQSMNIGSSSPGSSSTGHIPRLRNPPSNIPPSDQEIEDTLESARVAVLESDDPEMQLTWAQDALHQIDINTENRARLHAMNIQPTPQSQAEAEIRKDAVGIVAFLEEQHHPRAEFLMGTWYEFGKFGYRMDKKEAFRCYSRSAEKHYTRAVYRVGLLYESSNDHARALQNYRKGVALGDSACLYRLGMIVLRGQYDQPQDYAYGIDLVRQASDSADENAPQGAYIYGMMLVKELDQLALPPDLLWYDERAARIEIEKAAYLKSSKAQLKMGKSYELGDLGCEFNPLYSMHYYALAATQGEAEAEMGISKWFLVGAEGYFPKNEAMAYDYAKRAAASGLPDGEFAMGYFSELGIHVPRNIDRALDWYKKAAANGNIEAQERVRGIGQKQVLNRTDHEGLALQRIKSRHGSRRGGRPERLTAVNKMPTMTEGRPMPDSRQGRPFANGALPPRSSSIPPRASPAAPYPQDDRPPYGQEPRPPFRDSDRRPSGASLPGRPSGMPSPRIVSDTTFNQRQRMTPQQSPAMQSTSTFSSPRPSPDLRPLGSPRMGRQVSPGPPRPPKQPDWPISPPSSNGSFQHPAARPPRQSSATPGSSPRLGSRPSAPDLRKANGSAAPRPAPTPLGIMNTPPSPMARPAPSPTATKPPSRGPKTFEEMGVPKHKQESECIIM